MPAQPVLLADTPFVRRLARVGLYAGGLGIAVSAVVAVHDWPRFLTGYLLAFVFVAGITVTGVFFSGLQYLTRSGWSAAVRRIPELVGAFTPFLAVLLLPIAFGVGTLYHAWAHADPSDAVLAMKSPWLNPPFFVARLAVYFLIWLVLYAVIVGNSFRQDHTDDPAPTRRNWVLSAPATILYAGSITFAAFDLMMSLMPHWYSTIFGVYYFSGSLVGTLAVVTIVAVLLRKAGLLREWLTTERFHDLGKLLFAFNVFWAYIAFSQFLLIWYGNIPEEISFFKDRFMHGWEYVSYAVIFVHFVIPFVILLSQSAKRNPNVLLAGAVVLLAAHYIDLYWIVTPTFAHTAVTYGLAEFAALLALGGIFIYALARQFGRRSAIPVNDPFLREAVE